MAVSVLERAAASMDGGYSSCSLGGPSPLPYSGSHAGVFGPLRLREGPRHGAWSAIHVCHGDRSAAAGDDLCLHNPAFSTALVRAQPVPNCQLSSPVGPEVFRTLCKQPRDGSEASSI